MKPYWLPLLPRADIELVVWSVEDDIDHGGAERFATLFRATWALIPAADRRALLRYWADQRRQRSPSPSGRPAPRVPFVELCNGKSDFERSPGGKVRAQTNIDGSTLTFGASRLPRRDANVKSIVAHEIAHVRLIAAGCDLWNNRPADHGDAAVDYCLSPVETAADVLVNAWGLDAYLGLERRVSGRRIRAVIERNPGHPASRWLERYLRRCGDQAVPGAGVDPP